MGYVMQSGDSDRSVWALGSLVTALATAADTGDRFELLRYSAREGDAAPVHAHPLTTTARKERSREYRRFVRLALVRVPRER